MEEKELFERLGSLVILDHDAVLAYEKAIDDIRDEAIRTQIILYKGDHQRHVKDLSDVIGAMGGEPPELRRDAPGVFLEAMSAIQGEMGERSALRAIETGERYANYRYREAAAWDVPPDVMNLIERNYTDERRHLEYVQRVLETRQAWSAGRIGTVVGLGALSVAAGIFAWRQMRA